MNTKPKLNTAEAIRTLQDCFEASMDFDTAMGCAGLTDCSDYVRGLMKKFWDGWERKFEGE